MVDRQRASSLNASFRTLDTADTAGVEEKRKAMEYRQRLAEKARRFLAPLDLRDVALGPPGDGEANHAYEEVDTAQFTKLVACEVVMRSSELARDKAARDFNFKAFDIKEDRALALEVLPEDEVSQQGKVGKAAPRASPTKGGAGAVSPAPGDGVLDGKMLKDILDLAEFVRDSDRLDFDQVGQDGALERIATGGNSIQDQDGALARIKECILELATSGNSTGKLRVSHDNDLKGPKGLTEFLDEWIKRRHECTGNHRDLEEALEAIKVRSETETLGVHGCSVGSKKLRQTGAETLKKDLHVQTLEYEIADVSKLDDWHTLTCKTPFPNGTAVFYEVKINDARKLLRSNNIVIGIGLIALDEPINNVCDEPETPHNGWVQNETLPAESYVWYSDGEVATSQKQHSSGQHSKVLHTAGPFAKEVRDPNGMLQWDVCSEWQGLLSRDGELTIGVGFAESNREVFFTHNGVYAGSATHFASSSSVEGGSHYYPVLCVRKRSACGTKQGQKLREGAESDLVKKWDSGRKPDSDSGTEVTSGARAAAAAPPIGHDQLSGALHEVHEEDDALDGLKKQLTALQADAKTALESQDFVAAAAQANKALQIQELMRGPANRSMGLSKLACEMRQVHQKVTAGMSDVPTAPKAYCQFIAGWCDELDGDLKKLKTASIDAEASVDAEAKAKESPEKPKELGAAPSTPDDGAAPSTPASFTINFGVLDPFHSAAEAGTAVQRLRTMLHSEPHDVTSQALSAEPHDVTLPATGYATFGRGVDTWKWQEFEYPFVQRLREMRRPSPFVRKVDESGRKYWGEDPSKASVPNLVERAAPDVAIAGNRMPTQTVCMNACLFTDLVLVCPVVLCYR